MADPGLRPPERRAPEAGHVLSVLAVGALDPSAEDLAEAGADLLPSHQAGRRTATARSPFAVAIGSKATCSPTWRTGPSTSVRCTK